MISDATERVRCVSPDGTHEFTESRPLAESLGLTIKEGKPALDSNGDYLPPKRITPLGDDSAKRVGKPKKTVSKNESEN